MAGILSPFALVGPGAISWLGETLDSTANTDTYTFSATFGAAHDTRLLIAVVHWETLSDPGLTIANCSIGGVVPTLHVDDHHNGGSTGLGCAIMSALVPSGISGSVVIDFNGNCVDCAVSLFRAVNLVSNTPFDTLSVRGQNDTDINGTINVPSNGACIIGGTGSTNTTGNGIAFTGATEVYDKDYPSGGAGRIGAALQTGLNSESNRTCRFNMGAIANSGTEMMACTWQLRA